ncbi:hypothetical protein ScPMuIL_004644 [Solemya velum]
MFQNRKCKIIYMVLVSLGFLFITVGYGTPGWITINSISRNINTKVGFGLWYFRVCPVVPDLEDNICRTVDYKDQDNYYKGFQLVKSVFYSEVLVGKIEMNWTVYKVLATCAVVFSAVAVCLLVASIMMSIKKPNGAKFAKASYSIMFLAGIIVAVPVGRFWQINGDLSLRFGLSFIWEAEAPYSVILSGIGGVIDIVCALLLWYYVYKLPDTPGIIVDQHVHAPTTTTTTVSTNHVGTTVHLNTGGGAYPAQPGQTFIGLHKSYGY